MTNIFQNTISMYLIKNPLNSSLYIIKEIGVLRDTARAPQPPTNPPRGHQMSRQAWPKTTENAIFGQKCVVLGQKILIFTGESKSFGTHIG